MELTSKELDVARSPKMGIEKLEEQYTGQGYMQHCVAALGVRPTMLAGLLNVTERTLSNWASIPISEESQGKIDRLKTLYKIVIIVENEGLHGKIILNILNEPIPGEEGEKSLLHYVVDEPNNSLLATAVHKVIDSFK
jgi:hypothetical protein